MRVYSRGSRKQGSFCQPIGFREGWTSEPVRLSTDRATSLEMALLQQLAPVFAYLDDARAPTGLQRQRDLRRLALSLAGLVLLLSAVWGLLRVFVLRRGQDQGGPVTSAEPARVQLVRRPLDRTYDVVAWMPARTTSTIFSATSRVNGWRRRLT